MTPGSQEAERAAARPEWERRLADFLDVDAVADRIVEEGMEFAFPGQIDDGEFIEQFREGVRENVGTVQRVLAGRLRIEDVTPTRPLALAALQARLEIPESAIQQSYRVGTRVMVSEWTRLLSSHAAAEEIDVDEALGAVERFTAAIMAFQNRVLGSVSAAHETELRALRASRVQLRRQLIREVLAGERPPPSVDLSSALAYDVNAQHIAIVLSDCSEDRARQRTQAVRTALTPSGYLTFPLGAGATAVWLAQPKTWTTRMLRDVAAAFADGGVVASIGPPRSGLDGFRLTYEEARRAEAVRDAWGEDAPPVLAYADVMLESMALADVDTARRFVADELGELMGDNAAAARLRETLLVWFESGSHVSTAARLGLHEHTIRNRIQRAEEAIGHPLTTRRTELQVALRLRAVVDVPDA
jgi:PucR-like helix-turn-helix protein/diguanylate cyclase with GGDEF domain